MQTVAFGLPPLMFLDDDLLRCSRAVWLGLWSFFAARRRSGYVASSSTAPSS